MGFKLESIKLDDTNSAQEIIGKYDFPENNSLEKDRTFGFLCDHCRDYTPPCNCDDVCSYQHCKRDDSCPRHDDVDRDYFSSHTCSALDVG